MDRVFRREPRPDDAFATTWKTANQDEYPTGGNQVAELFAWKVSEHVHALGKIGLLLPAMTLFKNESASFRKAFFRDLRVHTGRELRQSRGCAVRRPFTSSRMRPFMDRARLTIMVHEGES